MKSAAFTLLAHRRAVLLFLQETLRYRLEDEAEGREPLMSDDVPFKDRVVSETAMMDVLDHLEKYEAMESLRISQFTLVDRSMPEMCLPPPPPDDPPKEKTNVIDKEQPKADSEDPPKAPAQQSTGEPERPTGQDPSAGAASTRTGRGARH